MNKETSPSDKTNTLGLLIRNISGAYIFDRNRELKRIEKAVIGIVGERIAFIGKESDLASQIVQLDDIRVVDAHGLTALPGFIDPHTHSTHT